MKMLVCLIRLFEFSLLSWGVNSTRGSHEATPMGYKGKWGSISFSWSSVRSGALGRVGMKKDQLGWTVYICFWYLSYKASLLSSYVCIYLCVWCMCMFLWVCTHEHLGSHTCVHTWKPRANVRCFLVDPPPWILRQGFSLALELINLTNKLVQGSFHSFLPSTGVIDLHCTSNFYIGVIDWIQVLILSW